MLADAAIATIAAAGMRGLTHRAVDRRAGLPEGSTSYYFRTRQALLRAAVERLVVLDTADLKSVPPPAGPVDRRSLAEALGAVAQRWVTDARERLLARYELALEAGRNPDLHGIFVGAGAPFRARAQDLLAAAGDPRSAHHAPLLVAALDGLLFDHLAGAGGLTFTAAGWREAIEELLAAALD